MATRNYPQRKIEYVDRLKKLFQTYEKILLVEADFVGSSQMQQIRLSLRKDPKAEILMGKNTMVRQVIRSLADEKPALTKLLAKRSGEPGYKYLRGNVGLVFTNGDAKVVRTRITENKVPAAAKAGNIATKDVTIPAGPTSLDPGQTSFFQVLNIPTKIAKGAIEILSDVLLIKTGQKVGASEVALLAKLDIKPFFYGLKVSHVYDGAGEGSVYDAAVLDLDDAQLLGKFFNGVAKLAAISLAIGIPTEASLPHSIANGFKKLLAISLATEYSFEEAQKIKDILANPGAFAAAAAPAAGGAAKAVAAKVEEEEEEDIGGGFSMFD